MQETMTFGEQLREFLRRNMSWFLAGAFTLLLLQDVFGTHGLVAMRHAQKEAASVQKDIDLINEENQQLQDRVQSLKNDPQAIEHIAREEMGLARPGEYIFKTAPRPGDTSNSGPAPTAAK
jgi:cell division protein FtsB